MMPWGVRSDERQLSWRWASVLVALLAIAVLAGFLLRALLQAEAEAEQLTVALTVRNMKTGLMMAEGEAIIAGRDADIRGWAGTNPVRWLVTLPAGYAGDCKDGDKGGAPPAGGWCFDARRGELRYRQRHAGPGGAVLGWRVALLAAEGGPPGVGIQSVLPLGATIGDNPRP